MPAFLKDLRRLSSRGMTRERSSGDKSSSSSHAASEQSQSGSSDGQVHGAVPTPSSTPSEPDRGVYGGSNTAPSALPYRPPPTTHPSQNARYSMVGASSATVNTSSSPTTPPLRAGPTSPLAPRILSISENSWVHQKVLLIYGQVNDPSAQPMDGTVWVCHHMDSFPATPWPVTDSHFKALVHLQPGPNRLRLDFTAPRVPPPPGAPAHSAWFNINYLPLNAAPPLDLVVLLGSDSPCEYDAVPDRKAREGNGLDMAIRKFKMCAYLWQAFTGEQMNRNGLGRRCFRFDEVWQRGTLSGRDAEMGTYRNEAKIHIVRTQKTVAELRDAEIAQQNKSAKDSGGLFQIVSEAVKDYFGRDPNCVRYASVLLLDSHWDPQAELVRGHAALGGGDDSLKLAIFGSHALQTYPSCLEEVVPAFSDCTRTDTKYVANDCGESGSNWEAANIGIGAHLHETGHLFGCPHQENGVMLRDYVRLNRTFTSKELYSTRTKSPGQGLVLQADECAWHRLDMLRFRLHPCFRLPTDPPPPSDDSIAVWSVESNSLIATAATGVAFVEIYAEGDDVCKAYIEYMDGFNISSLPKQISLSETDVRAQMAGKTNEKTKKIRLSVFSATGKNTEVPDFLGLISKSSRCKLPDGRTGFIGNKVGFSSMDGTRPEELHFWYVKDSRKQLRIVRVHHGMALDGVEFIYHDGSSQLIGKRGGSPDDFTLDMRRAESILGFYLRAGLWIDGIQIITNQGRKSPIYGNATGGSGHMLIPPRGYVMAGLSGSCAQFMDGFGLIITR